MLEAVFLAGLLEGRGFASQMGRDIGLGQPQHPFDGGSGNA